MCLYCNEIVKTYHIVSLVLHLLFHKIKMNGATETSYRPTGINNWC